MPTGLQIILLLAVAAVLLIRLIGTLGKRDGFEPEMRALEQPVAANDSTVIDARDDFDLDYYGEDKEVRAALLEAKKKEPDFRVNDFLVGSKQAYEMVVMAFLDGHMDEVAFFIDASVMDGFNQALTAREEAGEVIKAKFHGISDVTLRTAEFDKRTNELVLGVDYVAELTRIVYDKDGKVISGDKNKVEAEVDHWQYARVMGSDDLNWTLVATGE